MTRIALIHTGAVVIPAFTDLVRELLPDADVQHLLDDRIVSDLRNGATPTEIIERLAALGRAATTRGAEAILLTCSSISPAAAVLSDRLGVPVLRVDEAMADAAVASGTRIGVLATLPTTLDPTLALLAERAEIARTSTTFVPRLVAGAFDAVVAGDVATHDSLIREALAEVSEQCDVIVLAQASMARAADAVSLPVPLLTSPRLGVTRLRESLPL